MVLQTYFMEDILKLIILIKLKQKFYAKKISV